MSRWHKTQPKNGDVILHCGHIGQKRIPGAHWWKLPNGVQFVRPDGTKGEAGWIVSCKNCFDTSDGEAGSVEVRGDGIWTGDAPIIKAPS